MTDPREPDSYVDFEQEQAAQAAPSAVSEADRRAAKTGLAHSDRPLVERELEIPAAPPPAQKPLRLALLLVAGSLVLAALTGVVAWWIESERREGGVFGPRDEVLLMVQLQPSSARLYVDGVLQRSRSLQLARQRKQVVLRAEAPGYRSRQMLVRIDQTGVVQLRLSPLSGTPGTRKRSKAPQTAPSDQLDRTTVLTTLRQLNEPVRRCFIKHGEPGKLLLRATLRPEGRATGKLLGAFAKTKTGACVLDEVRRLRSPRFTGRPVTVDFPFVLQ